MGEIFKALQKLEVELYIMRQHLKLWILTVREYIPNEAFLNYYQNVFFAAVFRRRKFKERGDGEYFTL